MWNVKREFSKQQETMEEKEIRCPKCKGNKFSYAGDNAFKCAFCGTVFQVSATPAPTEITHEEKPIVVNVQMPQESYQSVPQNIKSKTTAGLLALFFGGWGIQWFYLGKSARGLVYLLLWIFFCWTVVVPVILAFISLIEAIKFFSMSQQKFNDKYCR